MFEKNMNISFLLDFYGEMLSEKQRGILDLYYNEDLSLAEIAENYGISRQGVRDVIVRAEGIMTEMEDKTGIIKRFHKMQKALTEASENMDKIISINGNKYFDLELDSLAHNVKETLEELKQE